MDIQGFAEHLLDPLEKHDIHFAISFVQPVI
jgi:hypothetical protein